VAELYGHFQHSDRIAMAEGYHEHQFSPENQESAMNFLDHFNGLPARHGLAPVKELDDKTLQCTRTGQVMLEFADARSLMDEIREYYLAHKNQPGKQLREMYYSGNRPQIDSWPVQEFKNGVVGRAEIRWESVGSSQFDRVTIEKYMLHHSQFLELPLLYIHKADGKQRPVLLWLRQNGKATAQDWPELVHHLDAGYDIVSIDPRGLGETRMRYKAVSPDDPSLAELDFDRAYVSPLSSVLADYVYNSLLTGRPYFLQMIEDVEIASRFVKEKLSPQSEMAVTGTPDMMSTAIAEIFPAIKLVSSPAAPRIRWSEIVEKKTELWPIEYLLPGGAYVH
jgi:hypothetical protein